MRRSSGIPTQWRWMRMIIFALLFFRLPRAAEGHQNELEPIRLDSIVPKDHQFRLPQVAESSRDELERTGLDSIIPGNHKWSWNWIMTEIKRGLPSFSDTEIIVGADELSDSDREFLVQVRKGAAPAFERLLIHFKQISGLSYSLSAPDFFYNRIKAVDQVIFDFLFRTLELHRENLLGRHTESEIIRVLGELNNQFNLPQLTEKEDIKEDIKEDLKNILYKYMTVFELELAIRNNIELPARINANEKNETVDDLSWRNHAAGYLNQPYIIATTITGLLLSFFWWRNHHEQTQRQQAAQELTDTIMAQLPAKDWQASYSLDDTGVQISYRCDLPDHLTLQIAGDEYSVTRDEFQRYLGEYFSTIRVGDQPCKVERIKAEKPENPAICIELPHLTKAQGHTIIERLNKARNDFFQQVKKAAPETQIPELLEKRKKLLSADNFFDAKVGMDLLEDHLTFTSDEYQNGIGKIIAFLENNVLGTVSSTDIRDQLIKLRYDSFEKLETTEKLKALLWLYCQLNTIAQLIIDPDRSLLFPPIASSKYVRLYRPFVEITQKMVKRGKLNLDAVKLFVMSMQNFINKVDVKDDFTSSESIVEGVKNQMERFLNEKNREIRKRIRKGTTTIDDNLTELTPHEKYQQLSALESITKLENEPIGTLPETVTRLLFFIRDSSGVYAEQLIQQIPKFSSTDKNQLKSILTRRITSPESLPVAAEPKTSQSETIAYWSEKIKDMSVTTGTSNSCRQMNVGLFYCLTRIIVLLEADSPEEQSSHLENLRFLFAHFGYALSFGESILYKQFSDFHSHLIGGSSRTDIEKTKLYKKLKFHADQREGGIDWKRETDEMLKVVRELQETLRSCSRQDNFNKDLFIPGMIIICGQIIPDLKRMKLLNLLNKVDKPLASQLALCVSTRNGLMHNSSFSISKQWINAMAAQLEPQGSEEDVGMCLR